jgi:UPF0042 nucleotide-binding protein
MKLLIVSGLSGAGKTIALHSLEDMGFYCVDNLPVNLLPAFAEQTKQLEAHEGVAVGIDARTPALHEMLALLQTLSDINIPYQILFLEADDEVLIKRFSETRRKHPLSSSQVPLREAIQQERQLLEPLARRADIRLNTSFTPVHQLRDMIRLQIKLRSNQMLSLLFQSFGFKYGIPSDADFVFDVRCLPNPYWEFELRNLTGLDGAVINFLQVQPKVQQMQTAIIEFLEAWLPQFAADNRNYLTVAIGCTGGQHRSVYVASQLAKHFSEQREGVLVRHRELP